MAKTIWITGLPGSGKSTISEELKKRHPEFYVLRMDEYRRFATPEPTYSDEEREIAYRSIVYIAKLLNEFGHDVIIDATGNMRRWRELARKTIPEYYEVYLKCSPEECALREAKRRKRFGAPSNIYLKGKAGWPVPGVNVPYEEPLNPEVVIETDRTPLDRAVEMIEERIFRSQPPCD